MLGGNFDMLDGNVGEVERRQNIETVSSLQHLQQRRVQKPISDLISIHPFEYILTQGTKLYVEFPQVL